MNSKWKRIFIGTVVALSVGAAAFFIYNYLKERRPFVFAGTLETTKVMISARVASDIQDVFVAEGDVVQQGQVLMEMSCDAYKIVGRQIDNDFERVRQLMQKGHVSQAEYDVLLRNKQDNDLKISWCRVVSPIDGMIVTKFREIGEVVAPGSVLMAVANPYDVWAYFYVPYSMLHQLKVGQKVVGFLPEANDMKFVGRIIKINEEAEFTPKNVQTRDERTRLVYGVKVQFENPGLILKAGMTIESTLLTDE